jgi:hypothetical protein
MVLIANAYYEKEISRLKHEASAECAENRRRRGPAKI